MYLKYLLFTTCLLAASISYTYGQISVFGNSCESYSPYIFDFMPASYETHCFELPEEQSSSVSQYTFSSEREIKAASHLEFADSMELTPEQGGSLYAYIQPLTFEVVAYVEDLNNVAELSKFELGIKPPETVLISIQNFLNETGTNELNPYMSDQIHIEAVFKQVTTDTVTYYDPPNHPEEVIYTDSIVKKRDGFFTKEVERDVSGFDSLYNHPLFNNTEHIVGEEYKSLGGSWTVSDSDYPFRVRFAPPNVGEWSCQIKINVQEGQQVYISPTFIFNVVNSNKKGYLQVDNNKRFLKRDGESFRPVGVNYPWPIIDGYPLRGLDNGNKLVNRPEYYGELPPIAHYEQYLRMMDTLAMNGANYFRLIMNPFSLDIEYEKLGDYTDRLHIAKELDLILERAEQNNMLINWNFMLHNTLQVNGHWIHEWDWSEEPDLSSDSTIPTAAYCYKTQIDDVETPLDFFTNDTAKKYYKERIRYIIARWGYSPDIGMFEHFSEISQIGKRYDYENSDYVEGTGQYEGNEEIFSDWHGEMSWFVKEKLEAPQLMSLSYTTDFDKENDDSFWHGNVDIFNFNNYNYFTGGDSPPHVYPFRDVVYNMFKNNEYGVYEKPVFLGEMGAQHVWNCDNNVETRRSIWQSYFLGISGGLEWEITKDLSIYSRARSFIEGVDLEGGNWHPGAFDRENDGEWKFNNNYHDDCVREDELADVVYLRSGDKEKAFGVITNRRANYYTLGEGECADDNGLVTAPVYSDSTSDDYAEFTAELQSYGPVSPSSGNNRLRIRNMALGSLGIPKEYKIKYYSPYDQVNSIKEETRWAPQLTLEFSEMDTLDIILFEVFPMGENFKSATNDTTSKDKEIKKRSNDELQKQEVLIYPNPNDGNFVVLLENPETVKGIYISNNLGQVVDSRNEVFKQNRYTLNYFNSGVYSVEVVYSDKTIRKKIIIN